MNLRSIKSNVWHWFLPGDKTETTRKIANRLYRNRILIQQDGNADGDWKKAERIRKNEFRRLLFWVNQPCIWTEKQVVEPVAHWLDRADFFQIIARLSPILEAFGVIAIPLVLAYATQRYQEDLQKRELEQLQQQTVATYLNQLSTILLDVKGDLRDPENEKLRTLTTATTLTLLRDPNLEGEHRSQVMRLLLRTKLVDSDTAYGPKRPDDRVTILNFNNAALERVNLSNTLLSATSLSGANLRRANLRRAELWNANLSGANLSGANLSKAELWNANLSRVNLEDVNLSGANLWGVNLSGANLADASLSGAYLCKTQLPKTVQLDPNRDCETLKQLYPWHFE